MRALSILLLLAAGSVMASAKMVTQAVSYAHDGVQLEGYLAYDDAQGGKRPAVIVVHEWWGLNDFAKEQARRIAELGYVGFAADMYGGGKNTTSREEARQMARGITADPARLNARAKAALDTVAQNPHVDAERIAAIGFCFGGTTVMQMAYSGLPLVGVVSFHGSLPAADESARGRIKAKILALHGAADTLVAPEDLAKFQAALGDQVDWQLIIYAGAKHAFTNPAADKAGIDGVAYQKAAAERSWQHMRLFLDEVFGKK